MNILVLTCSGKAGGNTEKLGAAFSQGCTEGGHRAQTIRFSQIEVKPCRGCNACRVSGRCVQRDGMEEIYQAFLECDLLALATPLYFWGPSAQMKLVIDRLYALGRDHPKGYFSYPLKKCVLLATAADSQRHFWVFESLQQYYQRLVAYLRWTDCGILLAGNCGGTKAPRRIEDTDWLDRAYHLGRRL